MINIYCKNEINFSLKTNILNTLYNFVLLKKIFTYDLLITPQHFFIKNMFNNKLKTFKIRNQQQEEIIIASSFQCLKCLFHRLAKKKEQMPIIMINKRISENIFNTFQNIIQCLAKNIHSIFYSLVCNKMNQSEEYRGKKKSFATRLLLSEILYFKNSFFFVIVMSLLLLFSSSSLLCCWVI